ncbi:hypothetical protein HHK36_030693 [Tetracentron sinense]|uniref:Peptidase C14 caspase domain-containing protein n=1 Tax=Tetracentron sinense TaxID=13715 RepID=A0A834Y812_TETSI|nr:hypothetical protein HHK36_030693 [Tetracentron sinense]
MILDDEINATIVRPLPKGVKLHAIIDACHSGTILDLPYLCRKRREGNYIWENNNPPSGARKGTDGGLAISFSACGDNQTCTDTDALSRDKVMTGAMTYFFIQAMQSDQPEMTYGYLLRAIHNAIHKASTTVGLSGPIAALVGRVFHTGFSQEPQLSSSEIFDIDTVPFIL